MSRPTLPATIAIRVREGVPNELAAFDLRYEPSLTQAATSDAADGAKFTHEVVRSDILRGLAIAYRVLARQECAGKGDPETVEYLAYLDDWVESHAAPDEDSPEAVRT